MKNFIKLQLTSVGWTEGFAIWQVRNFNDFNIHFKWDVYETGQSGRGIALAKYDVFFQTSLVQSPNTVRIMVNGINQNIKTARLTPSCYCSIEPLPEPLAV